MIQYSILMNDNDTLSPNCPLLSHIGSKHITPIVTTAWCGACLSRTCPRACPRAVPASLKGCETLEAGRTSRMRQWARQEHLAMDKYQLREPGVPDDGLRLRRTFISVIARKRPGGSHTERKTITVALALCNHHRSGGTQNVHGI